MAPDPTSDPAPTPQTAPASGPASGARSDPGAELTLLRSVGRALVASREESALMASVCQAIATGDPFRAAWIDIAGETAGRPVVPLAGHGWDPASLEGLRRSWAEGDPGLSPAGKALAEGMVQLVQDVAAVSGTPPWKVHALDAGYRAICSVPLALYGAPAALTVGAGATNAFDPFRLSVLQDVTAQLAYGIHALHDAERLRRNLHATVTSLSAAGELRDPYTAGHQRRVAEVAAAVSARLGLPEDDGHGIFIAGVVHDIGKLVVPIEILTKPARLSAAEFTLVKEHSRAGHDILSGIDFPWPVAQIVLQHHERMDGSGYPDGLGQDDITLGAAIVAVADVVEAMSAHRPYRPAQGLEAALSEIAGGRATRYHPEVADACIQVCRSQQLRFDPLPDAPFGFL